MSTAMIFAAVATLLGSALIGGVFFAFSTFIMKALGRLTPAAGITAMQSINIVVLNPRFLGMFMGTTALSVLVGAHSAIHWQAPSSPWFLAGAAFYFVGTFLVTGLGNVPLNNRLAGLSTADPAAARFWEHYLDRWTFLNTVRTTGAMIAAALFATGLIVQSS